MSVQRCRESSERNCYMISPRVIIKAIFIHSGVCIQRCVCVCLCVCVCTCVCVCMCVVEGSVLPHHTWRHDDKNRVTKLDSIITLDFGTYVNSSWRRHRMSSCHTTT